MIKHVLNKLTGLLLRDPWLVAKYAVVTAVLGLVGKAILVGAKDGADVPAVAAQFVPTIPMMVLTFLVHKTLWGQRDASFRSYVCRHWSTGYMVQFVIGHSLFIFFVVYLGLHYLRVSVALGIATAVAMFAYNEWKVFKRHEKEADMV